jgi:hypothetical protein
VQLRPAIKSSRQKNIDAPPGHASGLDLAGQMLGVRASAAGPVERADVCVLSCNSLFRISKRPPRELIRANSSHEMWVPSIVVEGDFASFEWRIPMEIADVPLVDDVCGSVEALNEPWRVQTARPAQDCLGQGWHHAVETDDGQREGAA